MPFRHHTNGLRATRLVVTAPAFASAANTPALLAGLTAAQIAACIGCKILGLLSDGTQRGEIICGDSIGSLPQHVAAGADYYEPANSDATLTFFKVASGASVATVVIVFYFLE